MTKATIFIENRSTERFEVLGVADLITSPMIDVHCEALNRGKQIKLCKAAMEKGSHIDVKFFVDRVAHYCVANVYAIDERNPSERVSVQLNIVDERKMK